VLKSATAHDSPGGWGESVATGKFETTEFTATVFLDKANATHAALFAAQFAKTLNAFTVATPGAGLTFTGNAFVVSIEDEAKQDDVLKAKITFAPSGSVSIT
ncbi:MAG TPA: phage tail tube protein, partial [Thermoflexales bacterium]|nr:phage tail tube protein [Thermoflexales bacterium]